MIGIILVKIVDVTNVMNGGSKLFYNESGLCVVALSKNLILTTTLNRAITQNPCYVPFLFRLWNKKRNLQEN